MQTIFINTENSKTNERHKFRLTLVDKLNLKGPNKNMALANLSIYYTWNLNITTINLKFQLQKFQFNEIQDYFECIIKKHETIADNPSVQIYVNKIKNRIFFKNTNRI